MRQQQIRLKYLTENERQDIFDCMQTQADKEISKMNFCSIFLTSKI